MRKKKRNLSIHFLNLSLPYSNYCIQLIQKNKLNFVFFLKGLTCIVYFFRHKSMKNLSLLLLVFLSKLLKLKPKEGKKIPEFWQLCPVKFYPNLNPISKLLKLIFFMKYFRQWVLLSKIINSINIKFIN